MYRILIDWIELKHKTDINCDINFSLFLSWRILKTCPKQRVKLLMAEPQN